MPPRLHHVQLSAPPGSEERARAFYGGILGLEEVAKPAHLRARGGIWLALADGQLHIGIEEGFRPSRRSHPAFEVEEVDAVRARLEAHGVTTVDDEPLPGWKRFYASDPFGNRLEFLSRRPPA